MCRFIKESGERCGNDAEPFCHLHEDTPQSHFYYTMEELGEDLEDVKDLVSEAERSASPPSELKVIDGTCDDCGSALRRSSRVSRHPNQPRRLVFEEVVECECDEHVLDAWSAVDSELPEGWA